MPTLLDLLRCALGRLRRGVAAPGDRRSGDRPAPARVQRDRDLDAPVPGCPEGHLSYPNPLELLDVPDIAAGSPAARAIPPDGTGRQGPHGAGRALEARSPAARARQAPQPVRRRERPLMYPGRRGPASRRGRAPVGAAARLDGERPGPARDPRLDLPPTPDIRDRLSCPRAGSGSRARRMR